MYLKLGKIQTSFLKYQNFQKKKIFLKSIFSKKTKKNISTTKNNNNKKHIKIKNDIYKA